MATLIDPELRRPEDLAKVAAWSYLIWRHDRANQRPTVREGR